MQGLKRDFKELNRQMVMFNDVLLKRQQHVQRALHPPVTPSSPEPVAKRAKETPSCPRFSIGDEVRKTPYGDTCIVRFVYMNGDEQKIKAEYKSTPGKFVNKQSSRNFEHVKSVEVCEYDSKPVSTEKAAYAADEVVIAVVQPPALAFSSVLTLKLLLCTISTLSLRPDQVPSFLPADLLLNNDRDVHVVHEDNAVTFSLREIPIPIVSNGARLLAAEKRVSIKAVNIWCNYPKQILVHHVTAFAVQQGLRTLYAASVQS